MQLADTLQIEGTPAVFVNGEKIGLGAVPTDQIWLVIDRALRSVGENPPPTLPAAPTPPGHGDSH